MTTVQLNVRSRVQISLADGRLLVVGPGEIVGSLTLVPGEASQNGNDGIAENRGPLRAQLDFTDAAGVPRRFSRILPAEVLLPSASEPVRCVDDQQIPRPLITALLDDRTDMRIRLADGATVVIRRKYIEARFSIQPYADHALVTAVIQPISDPHVRKGVLAVEYEVPWERLLWEVPRRLVDGVAGIGPEVTDRVGAAPEARSVVVLEAGAIPAKTSAAPRRLARGPRRRWPVAVRVVQHERQVLECPDGRRLVIELGSLPGY